MRQSKDYFDLIKRRYRQRGIGAKACLYVSPCCSVFCSLLPQRVLHITLQKQLSPKIKGFALNFGTGCQSYIGLLLTQVCAVPIATLFSRGKPITLRCGRVKMLQALVTSMCVCAHAYGVCSLNLCKLHQVNCPRDDCSDLFVVFVLAKINFAFVTVKYSAVSLVTAARIKVTGLLKVNQTNGGREWRSV